MTREKAIKTLKWFKAYNEEDYCGGDRIQDEHGDWYYRITEQDFEAFEMAIKALEQEPILDKIRAEIEQLSTYDDITGKSYFACEFKSDVLDVIDKYKAESEE